MKFIYIIYMNKEAIQIKNQYTKINENYLYSLLMIKRKQIEDTLKFFYVYCFIILFDLVLMFFFTNFLYTIANLLTLILILIINIVTIFILRNHCSLFYIKMIILIHLAFNVINICNIGWLIYKRLFINFIPVINYIGKNRNSIGYLYFAIMLYLTINISIPISSVLVLRKLIKILIKYEFCLNNSM